MVSLLLPFFDKEHMMLSLKEATKTESEREAVLKVQVPGHKRQLEKQRPTPLKEHGVSSSEENIKCW